MIYTTNIQRIHGASYDINLLQNPEELNKLTQMLGGLDLLVISSGTGKINETLSFSEERLSIDTNVLAFTQIVDWAYWYFKSNQKPGHIVGISSVAGIRGGRYAPAYNASKAYQINYLESIRHKAAYDKIDLTVTDICPGFVDTAMGQAKNRFWLSTPQRAAELIYRAIRKKRNKAYITGRWIWIALLLKVMPEPLFRKI